MAIANNMHQQRLITPRGDWIDKIDRRIMPFVEYEGYSDRYPAKSGINISEYQADEIREVSKKLFNIFAKTVEIFQRCPDDFMESMEIPDKLIPYLHKVNSLRCPTWLSRFDFVLDEQNNLHMVEINADTPCAVVEAYYANEVFCQETKHKNINEECYGQLKDFLLHIYEHVYCPEMDLDTGEFSNRHPFIFSCFEDYPEDYATTLFLMNTMQDAIRSSSYPASSVEFQSFYGLKVNTKTGDIDLPDGRTARAIYRLHPMELLIDEEAEDGTPIGTIMMDGYQRSRFTMFNPPEAIIMQSKAFQALVWMLAHHPSGQRFYTLDEIQTIEKYMLPTYFSREDWLANRDTVSGPWIVKPIWGREGHGIEVVSDDEQTILEKYPEYDTIQRESRNSIYQQFVHQPMYQADTDSGKQNGCLTLSCFMLEREPSALYCRFSPEEIAGTEAYFTPLYSE